MNSTVLSKDILYGLNEKFNPEDDKDLKAICDAIATAVVDHIKKNAEITPTTPGAPMASCPIFLAGSIS